MQPKLDAFESSTAACPTVAGGTSTSTLARLHFTFHFTLPARPPPSPLVIHYPHCHRLQLSLSYACLYSTYLCVCRSAQNLLREFKSLSRCQRLEASLIVHSCTCVAGFSGRNAEATGSWFSRPGTLPASAPRSHHSGFTSHLTPPFLTPPLPQII